MNSKERMKLLLTGEIPDRVGRAEAPWPETRARWHREGLPKNTHALDYFKLDIRQMIRVDFSFRLPEVVEEDTAEYRVVRTSEGSLEKQWKRTGVPHALDFALKDADDWARLRDNLVPGVERIGFGYYGDYASECVPGPYADVKKTYQQCPTNEDTFTLVGLLNPYESFLTKIGDEQLLIMLVTEPKLIADMFDTHVQLVISMVDLLFQEGFKPDGVFLSGDMAYRNGLLFSPAIYREFLMPCDRAIIQHVKNEYGLPVIYHSDGNCMEALPLLIEAGIDCIDPMEVAAGIDIRECGLQFRDQLAFMGNISPKALAGDEQTLREEVESKVKFAARNRCRYIFHSDHSLPSNVSFANYSLALQIAAEHGNY